MSVDLCSFLPATVQDAIVAMLDGKLVASGEQVNVATIGAKDFDDNDQLTLVMPAVRVRYDSSSFKATTNSACVYNAEHMLQLWCAAENLSGGEGQRDDTLTLLGVVLAHIVGKRLNLPDQSQSDPLLLRGVSPLEDDNIGLIYIITVAAAGSAQFPGGQ